MTAPPESSGRLRRIAGLVRKEALQILRDPSSYLLAVVLPCAETTRRVGPRFPVEKIGTTITWSRARFLTSEETTSTKRG